MAYVQFWKGPASGYNAGTHGEGIYQCTDTRDTYIFGILNKGTADEGGSDLVIGETTGTAFDGGRGKAVEDNIKILPKTIVLGSDYSGNVFTVTPTQTAVNINGVSKVVGEEDSITHNASSFVISSATPSKAGVMSAADKAKLDGLPSSLSSYATQSWVNSQGFASVDDIPTVPTNVSSFNNDSGYQTAAQVNTAIQAVVGAAPAALDTLKEIADALNNDPDFAATMTTELSKKADKSEIPSLTGYATESWVNTKLSSYATQSYVNSKGYATQDWVTEQGFLTSVPSEYVTNTELSNELADYATQTWVNRQGFLKSVPSTYATQSWVNSQGFLTSVPSNYITSTQLSSQLSSYATQTWVNQQGFLKAVPSEYVTETELNTALGSYATQTWVTGKGYLTSSALSGYATQSWVTSQGFAKDSYGENFSVTDYVVDLTKGVFYMEVDSSCILSTSGSLSNGQSCYVIIKNTWGPSIDVTLPNNAIRSDGKSDSMVTVPGDGYMEMSIVKVSTGYLYIIAV